MRYLTLNLLLLICVSAIAQAPTVPASNIVFTNVACNEFTAVWTNGNGSDRIVFVREGSAFSDVPDDGEYYTDIPVFSKGETIKKDSLHFCVYKGVGNSIRVTGLKNNTKYYVAVFEYNSKGAGLYEYLTTSFAKKDTTTKNILPVGYLYDFWDKTTKEGDVAQCLVGNSFQFKNKSTCDLSPLKYSWKFGDGDTSNLPEPKHTYKTPGIKQVILIARAPGCYSSISFKDTVYPHPFTKFYLDPALFPKNDTLQCWYGNRFIFLNNSTLLDIGVGPSSMRYDWYEVPSSTPFSNGYKTEYKAKTDGVVKIKLVAISNRGCRDSTFRYYKIKPRAFDLSKISITPKSLPLKNNKFTFTNSDTKTWQIRSKKNSFKDSIRGMSVNYSFNAIGWYYISFDSTDVSTGCYDKYTDSVEVKQDVGKLSNKALASISIYPNPSQSGIFTIHNLPVNTSIRIYDIIGKELINFNTKQTNTEINLSGFGAGTYILSLWSEGRKFDYRLVVL